MSSLPSLPATPDPLPSIAPVQDLGAEIGAVPSLTVDWDAAGERAANLWRQQQVDKAMAFYRRALAKDPRARAEADRIAKQFGVDPDTAESNMDVFRQWIEERDASYQLLRASSPALAQVYQDQEFANLFRDKVKDLGAWDSFWGSFREAQLTDELGVLYQRSKWHDLTEDEKTRLFTIENQLQENQIGRGWFASAGSVAGSLWGSFSESAAIGLGAGAVAAGSVGLIGAAPTAGLSVPGAFLAAFFSTFAAARAARSYVIQSGLDYRDMILSNMDPNVAAGASIASGLVNAALDFAGFRVATGSFRRAIAQHVSRELMTRPTIGRAAAEVATAYVKGVLGETSTEVAQDLVSIATKVAAQNLGGAGGQDVDLFSSETGRQLLDTAVTVAQGMMLVGIPGAAMDAHRTARKIAAARQDQATFKAIAEGSASTIELADRSATRLERFLVQASDGSDRSTVYVEAAKLNSLLEQNPGLRDQLRSVVPEFEAQFDEQLRVGGDLTMPTATYQALMAGLPISQVLQPIMRLSLDAPALVDLQEAEAIAKQQIAAMGPQVEAEYDAMTEFQKSASAVETAMADQINTAAKAGAVALVGRVARENARLYRDFVAVQAARLGVTPEQFHQEFGIKQVLFDPTKKAGIGGTYSPSERVVRLTNATDFSTFAHEAAHHFLETYTVLAAGQPVQGAGEFRGAVLFRQDLDTLLQWFGVEGATEEERRANWTAKSTDERRVSHEAFARNFEEWLSTGRAPSVERSALYQTFRAWMMAVYKGLRETLNAAFKADTGQDLPAATGEVRAVMDRMLASEDQIQHAEAARSMMPAFQTRDEFAAAGNDPADYDRYLALHQEAHDAAVVDLSRASERQARWILEARKRLERGLEGQRRAVAGEIGDGVTADLMRRPVNRARAWLRTGKLVDENGQQVADQSGETHHLDAAAVESMQIQLAEPMLAPQPVVSPERQAAAALAAARARRVELNRELADLREELRDEVEQEIRTLPVNRAARYVRDGVVVNERGEKIGQDDRHRLSADAVANMPGVDQKKAAKFVAKGGLNPDTVAAQFGFADGAELVAALMSRESLEDQIANAINDRIAIERPELLIPQERESEMRAAAEEQAVARFGPESDQVRADRERGFSLRLLGKMVAKDGLAPDAVAPMFGYANGVELVRALLTEPTLRDQRRAEIDRRLLAEYPELADPAAKQAWIETALANEARQRFVAAELRALSRNTTNSRVVREAARMAAEQLVAGRIVSEATPQRFAVAAARLASQVRQLLRDGDTIGAYRAEMQRLVQMRAVTIAGQVQQEVTRAERQWAKFFKSDVALAKSRDINIVNVGRSILAYFGFRAQDRAPSEFLEQMRQYNPDAYAMLAPIVTDATSTTVRDVRKLSVQQFRNLRDALASVWQNSITQRQALLDDRKVALESVAAMLIEQASQHDMREQLGARGQPTEAEMRSRMFENTKARMMRVESWCVAMDKGKKGGPFTMAIYRPMARAVDAWMTRLKTEMRALNATLSKLDLKPGTIDGAEIDYQFGRRDGMGKAELLGALLHIGNPGNYERLLINRQWGTYRPDGSIDDTRFRNFLNRMFKDGVVTKADMDAIQSIWNTFERIKPDLQRAHYEVEGRNFKEVQAWAVDTPFGTYRGGYAPAVQARDVEYQRFVKDDELRDSFNASLPRAPDSFTKERAQMSDRPLQIDLRLVRRHLHDSLLYVYMQPAAKSVLRVLNDKGVRAALASVQPAARDSLLVPWLEQTTRQLTQRFDGDGFVNRFLQTMTKRFGMLTMMNNVKNTLQQPTGLITAALYVRPTMILRGLWKATLGGHGRAVKEASDASPYMREVLTGELFDLQRTFQDVLENPSLYRSAQKLGERFTYWTQSLVQRFCDLAVWHGSFQQETNALTNEHPEWTPDQIKNEAISRADSAQRQSFGSRMAQNIAPAEAGSALAKVFTQFSSYQFTQVNALRSQWVAGNQMQALFLAWMVPAIVAGWIVKMLGGGFEDDDEDGLTDDYIKWALATEGLGLLGLVPVAGPMVASTIKGIATGTPSDDRMSFAPSISAAGETAIGAGKAAMRIAGGQELSGKNVTDLFLSLPSLATGIPLSAMNAPIRYLYDVWRGQVVPAGPGDAFRGAVTGQASPGTRR